MLRAINLFDADDRYYKDHFYTLGADKGLMILEMDIDRFIGVRIPSILIDCNLVPFNTFDIKEFGSLEVIDIFDVVEYSDGGKITMLYTPILFLKLSIF